MKRKITMFLAAMLSGIAWQQASAQDIHFSQFYENAIMRNPALTGIFSGDYRAGINYRTQWSNISVPFQTALASCETRVLVNPDAGDYISFGLAFMYDKAGTINFNSMMVYPAINYNKCLGDEKNSYLSMGITGGYIQRSVDPNKMTFSSQYVNGGYSTYNPSGENLSYQKIQDYDFGAGLSLNSSIGSNINYYLGTAVYHITQPAQTFGGLESNFTRLTMKWEGNFGLQYRVNEQYAVTVHANYSNQHPYEEWIGGGFVSWSNIPEGDIKPFTISGGLFYRVKDAIIPTVKLDYNNYAITFSYDVNNSTLQPATAGAGGFEISLFTRGNFSKARKATDLTRCPRFEDILNPSF